MNRSVWLRTLPPRMWRSRRRWLWLVVTLALSWAADSPAVTGVGLIVLVVSVIFVAKVIPPATMKFAELFGRRLRWISQFDRQLVGTATGCLGLAIIYVAILAALGVVSGSLYFATVLPEKVAALAERAGIKIDRDFLLVFFLLIAVSLVATLTAIALTRLLATVQKVVDNDQQRAGDSGFRRNVDVLTRTAEGAREYSWLLFAILISFIPPTLRASWVPNILAAIVAPGAILWARRDYAGRDRPRRPQPERSLHRRDPFWRWVAWAFLGTMILLFIVISISYVFSSEVSLRERLSSLLFGVLLFCLGDAVWPLTRAMKPGPFLTPEEQPLGVDQAAPSTSDP